MNPSLFLLVLLAVGLAIGWLWLPRRGGADGRRERRVEFADIADRLPGVPDRIVGTPPIERRSELGVERLMTIASVGFFDWNLQSGVIGLGGPWRRMLGYEPHEFGPETSHDPWLQLCHDRDLPAVKRQMHELMDGGRSVLSCALRMHSAKDSWQWMHMNARTVEWQADGKARRILCTLTDIDAAKRTEHILASERRLFFFRAGQPARLRSGSAAPAALFLAEPGRSRPLCGGQAAARVPSGSLAPSRRCEQRGYPRRAGVAAGRRTVAGRGAPGPKRRHVAVVLDASVGGPRRRRHAAVCLSGRYQPAEGRRIACVGPQRITAGKRAQDGCDAALHADPAAIHRAPAVVRERWREPADHRVGRGAPSFTTGGISTRR